jgi:hypothetical protein
MVLESGTMLRDVRDVFTRNIASTVETHHIKRHNGAFDLGSRVLVDWPAPAFQWRSLRVASTLAQVNLEDGGALGFAGQIDEEDFI